MASITLSFSSLNERQMRRVLLAHKHVHEHKHQPISLSTTYATENDNRGIVGCVVRIDGTGYRVTTMPLEPAAAAIVAASVDQPTEAVDQLAASLGYAKAATDA